jgi:hypothetical protein
VPLLRNYKYVVRIVEVLADGYGNKEDAFEKRPANMVASIEVDEGNLTDVVFNEQYYIATDGSELVFFKEEGNRKSLRVKTDYAGWTVENPVEWLDVVAPGPDGIANSVFTLTLAADKLEPGEADRSGSFYIVAGALRKEITVTQRNEEEFWITVTGLDGEPVHELLFGIGDGSTTVYEAEREVRVEWRPVAAPCVLSTATVGTLDAFVFNEPASLAPLAGGSVVLTVRPKVLAAGDVGEADPVTYARASRLDFTVTSGGGQVKMVPLSVRQVNEVVEPVVDATYLMDGEPKSFGVRSKYPFEVAVTSNPGGVLTLVTTEGVASTGGTGTLVYFDLVDDVASLSVLAADVVLTVSSPGGRFRSRDVTIKCVNRAVVPESNSYIVAPGGDGFFIPVSRANRSDLGEQLGAGEAFTADLVWTDNSLGIAAASNIAAIAAAGTGSGGYLYVKPGSVAGNAVVAIKNGLRVLWSWHIWSPVDVPAQLGSKGFMDRNLGALTKTPGLATTLGLHYQWGRKDPFPGSASTTTATEVILYDRNGSAISIDMADPPTATDPSVGNIGAAVANPLTFYRVAATLEYRLGWYGGSANYDKTFW